MSTAIPCTDCSYDLCLAAAGSDASWLPAVVEPAHAVPAASEPADGAWVGPRPQRGPRPRAAAPQLAPGRPWARYDSATSCHVIRELGRRAVVRRATPASGVLAAACDMMHNVVPLPSIDTEGESLLSRFAQAATALGRALHRRSRISTETPNMYHNWLQSTNRSLDLWRRPLCADTLHKICAAGRTKETLFYETCPAKQETAWEPSSWLWREGITQGPSRADVRRLPGDARAPSPSQELWPWTWRSALLCSPLGGAHTNWSSYS